MKTDKMLAAGLVAVPLFFVTALTQAFTKDGFDITRHMISQLATGPLGWIQTANFIVTGALFAMVALGLRRRMTEGIGRVWAPRSVGVFAAGLIGAGLFACDPIAGYPVGAAEVMTWHGTLHGVASGVAGLALLAFDIIVFRRLRAQGNTTAAPASLVAFVVFLVGPFTIPGLMSVTFAAASFLAWGWVAVFAAGLRAAPVSAPRAHAELVAH
ncbi:DUF998 domain-containing protein [Nocardia fluminea]|uniref:Uncharacterized protein DUF998 n=1 Tax=Nocardia fluminea TaxID=134984 RepID=A0A2N3VBL3_9NOCA|nr:DUF998 domain-containing protein [Nocardia fluminea]PKV79008.1 uncharacterized protein DUF998 [Nocardia fluminea]